MSRSRRRPAEGAGAEVGALAAALVLVRLRLVVVLGRWCSHWWCSSSGWRRGRHGAASGDNATARMAAATAALGGRAVEPRSRRRRCRPSSPRSIRRSLA